MNMFLAVLALSCAARAPAPQHQQWIPADADLVAHLDLAAASKGVIGRRVLDPVRELGVDSLDGFAEWTRSHPLGLGERIRSLTTYTTAGDAAPAVLVVAVTPPVEELFDDLPAEARHWVKTVDGLRVHSFETGGRRLYANAAPRVGDVHPLVFCTELDALFDALAVISGRRARLSDTLDAPARITPRADTYLYVAAANVNRLSATPASALLRESAGLVLEAGEADGRFRAMLRIRGKDEETAGYIAAMAQGLIATARLVAGSEDTPPDVKQGRMFLLDALRVNAEKDLIEAGLECDAERLVEVLDDGD